MNRAQRRKQAQEVAAKVGKVLTKTGNIAKATSELLGAEGVTKAAIAGIHLIKAIRGDKENPIGWYQKYVVIKPAKNLDRPMDPLFNTSITTKATEGSVCRFVEVDMDWTRYSDTFMFRQIVESSYRKIRDDLKSNLPYTSTMVRAYLIQAIALTVAAKQIERNVQWNNFSHPTIRNFAKMWRLRGNYRGYGISTLRSIPYLASDTSSWSETIAAYELLVPIFNATVRMPDSLGRFISHYFGSVFIDSGDGYADQYIRNTLHTIDWANYDKKTDSLTITTMDLDAVDPNTLLELLDQFQVTFGLVLADLKKSKQLTSVNISRYGDYLYTAVYDKSYLQALINAYTSPSNVQDNGYIRLDELADVEDHLTQFIFMGALQQSSLLTNSGKSNVPAITVLSMTLKYDSDNTIEWPASLEQFAGNQLGDIVYSAPIGITVTSDISSDTYVTANANTAVRNLPWGQIQMANSNLTTASGKPLDLGLSQELGEIQLGSVPDILLNSVEKKQSNWNYAIFVPLFYALTTANGTAGSSKIGVISGAIFTFDPNNQVFTGPKAATAFVSNATFTAQQMMAFLSTACDTLFVGSASSSDGEVKSLDGDSTLTLYINPSTTTNPTTPWKLSQDSLANLLTVTHTGLPGVGAYIVKKQAAASNIVTWHTVPLSSGTYSTYTFYSGANAYNAISLASILSGAISGTNIQAVTSGAVNSIGVTAGFSTIAAWVADQFDWHIPMRMSNTTSVTLQIGQESGDPITIDVQQNGGTVLIKEAYAPYYYNILDLVPTLYNMFASLFDTHD